MVNYSFLEIFFIKKNYMYLNIIDGKLFVSRNEKANRSKWK